MLLAFQRRGALAGAVTVGAIRNGYRTAMRDERREMTYPELDECTNALANAWRDKGLEPGDGVAILVRNHHGFLDAVSPPPNAVRRSSSSADTLDALIASSSTKAPPRTGMGPKIVILTGGTTGTPKGAPLDEPRSLGIIGGLLSRVPFRAPETTELAVPLFHALGFASMVLGPAAPSSRSSTGTARGRAVAAHEAVEDVAELTPGAL